MYGVRCSTTPNGPLPAGRAMQLDPDEPAPLALYPANCRWRQVVLDRLDRAGRPWTVAVQSSGIAGILAALDSLLDPGVEAVASQPVWLHWVIESGKAAVVPLTSSIPAWAR